MNIFFANESKILSSGLDYERKRDETCDKNLCKTQEEAEAFLALIQLRRLWWEWKDEPTDDFICEMYFGYDEERDSWDVISDWTSLPLMFYRAKNAEQFLEHFKGLFDKIKVLYKLTTNNNNNN